MNHYLLVILSLLTAPSVSWGATTRSITVDTIKNSTGGSSLSIPGSGTGVLSDASSLAASKLTGPVAVANQTISAQAISGSNIDWSTGNTFTQTLSANTTFTFSNAVSGQRITVRLTNTASNYTVAWPTVYWSGGTSPTMSTGAKSDLYSFFYDGTNYYGSAVQNLSLGFPSIAGCDSLTTDGNFKVCTMNNSGTVTVTGSGTMDMLLVGGGGGTGSLNGGGGGAGGVLYQTGVMVGGGSYPITVGAGGVGSTSVDPTDGGNSTFDGFTAVGGGAGGSGTGTFTTGHNGGSGGGNAYNITSSGGTGTSGQGHAGGGGNGGSPFSCGGGGGASTAGGNASGGTAGNGGAGVSNSITGSSVTYGGGGGGATSGSTAGTGGSGGGGNGGVQGVSNCSNGTNGLGGGAGGAGSPGNSCNGGKGVVIIRYEFQ